MSDADLASHPRAGEQRRAEPAATLVESDDGPGASGVSDGSLPTQLARGDEMKAVSRERKAARAMSQTGMPSAPAPSSKLVPLVIAAAVVVALLAIAVVVKVMGSQSVASVPPPKPVVVVPEPVVPTPPPEEPVVVPPEPVEEPKAPVVTAKQVADKYKKLSTRFAALPKASRANAQKQLKGLKGCAEPPETCLQQLERLEKKWFKK